MRIARADNNCRRGRPAVARISAWNLLSRCVPRSFSTARWYDQVVVELLGKISDDFPRCATSHLRLCRRSDAALWPARRTIARTNRTQDSSRGMERRQSGCRPMNAPANKPAPAAHLTRARLLSILGALTIFADCLRSGGRVCLAPRISVSCVPFPIPTVPDHAIFFGARLPRVMMGVIVGAMLAAVGTALQALVRNPLAEGGILGNLRAAARSGADTRARHVCETRRWRGARSNVRIRRRAALDRRGLPARDG